MNIDRFKNHHTEILSGIAVLRKLAHQGVADYAIDIAQELRALSQVVTQHLAIEDRILYPSLERSGDGRMAQMSRTYQNDMQGIATSFINFSRRWSNIALLQKNPDGFRDEANQVLKNVHTRMVRENHEFYPAIESM
ncbi:hemerythrin domain-containing protein [Castellaniella sp.]|uniref:hemerythrin domain-containing protein n=1 Tax=Castellaniella sp. TaxID=1955812 RepID=UPI002AFEFA6B|nr:hemerythrin domain-containing protein [Castellaniella sp.]